MNRESALKVLDSVQMGRRIRSQREFLRMTRREVAEYLHVSQKFILDLESGARGISVSHLHSLAWLLGVSTDYILAGKTAGEAEEDRKERLTEDILEPLKGCSVNQLRCMEQITRFYVEALEEER